MTVIYQLPEQLKGAEKLFLYERSNLDKGTEIVVDRDKVTLIFEKRRGICARKMRKTKLLVRQKKEDTEDKKRSVKEYRERKETLFSVAEASDTGTCGGRG